MRCMDSIGLPNGTSLKIKKREKEKKKENLEDKGKREKVKNFLNFVSVCVMDLLGVIPLFILLSEDKE